MNPHRMAWGFSMDLPFAFIVFVTTVLGFAFSKEPKRVPLSREIVLLLALLCWMVITTLDARYQFQAWEQWDKVWRIQLGILLTLMLTNSRDRVVGLVWTIGLSLAFYGAKGGLWTILHGGANRVYGPPGTFIGGNNEIGLAMVMTAPILWYLAMHAPRLWIRLALYCVVGLTLISIVGTHSRGALVGLAVIGLMLFMKAKNKVLPAALGLVFLLVLPHVMPQEWFDRMHTIETYEEDQSATNRIKAWRKGIQIANAKITGGGFEYLTYSNGTDAHSIYFEILSEHGYPGLALFLTLGAMTWFKAGRVRRMASRQPGFEWARDLGAMMQVSLAGYASSGAFLGLAYFDLFYVLIVVVVVLESTVRQALSAPTALSAEPAQGATAEIGPLGYVVREGTRP